MAMAVICVGKPSNNVASLHAALLRNRAGLVNVGGERVRLPLISYNCRSGSSLAVRCSSFKDEAGRAAVSATAQAEVAPAATTLGRSSFPPDFTFGAASAAYQIEGAAAEGGRGPSVWDAFCKNFPEKIKDRSNGDVACDSYHKYKEDVKLLVDMGADAYRFSISWSRILPKGTLAGGINQEGIQYYNNVINECIKNGIKPFVTLFHWDVPQALEDSYGGFLDRKIVQDFKDFSEICFQQFGDRVKHWITLNEPWSFSSMGYGLGYHAPGRCSKMLGCPVGDSTTEPYIVAHNLILAHGTVAKLYKDNYQADQQGNIGITLVSMWYKAYDHLHHSFEAQARSLDFMLAWFMDPLVFGDYPFNMRSILRDRLPAFSDDDTKMIQGSFDFIGLNYYTARFARSVPMKHTDVPFLSIKDSYSDILEVKDGVPIGTETGTWIYVHPEGLRELLTYIKRRYHNPAIYITENGICEIDDPGTTLEEALQDTHRTDYLHLHLSELKESIKEGVNVKGYIAWALTDNFEWEHGYTNRFGLHYVDFKNNQKRYPKRSAKWFTEFLKS